MSDNPSIESLRDDLRNLTNMEVIWREPHDRLSDALTELGELRSRGNVVSRDAFDTLLSRIAALEAELAAERMVRGMLVDALQRLQGFYHKADTQDAMDAALAAAAELEKGSG